MFHSLMPVSGFCVCWGPFGWSSCPHPWRGGVGAYLGQMADIMLQQTVHRH
jgi:hypothetical protein